MISCLIVIYIYICISLVQFTISYYTLCHYCAPFGQAALSALMRSCLALVGLAFTSLATFSLAIFYPFGQFCQIDVVLL